MDEIELTTDLCKYRDRLERIYQNSIEYFMKVEGRTPLSAFDDIHQKVPELPENCPIVCYAFLYQEEIIGYTWVMDEIPDGLYYILHFVIAEQYRRRKLGTKALTALDEIYKNKYDKSELLVSTMNYAGINLGYCFKSNDKIMLDLSFGKGLTGQPFQTQVLSLMYGHEFRNSDLFGTQIGIGPGVMRVLNEDSVYSYRPSATMVLQHRFYITQKSFVGFSAKALLSKETYGTSFVGVIWGTKL